MRFLQLKEFSLVLSKEVYVCVYTWCIFKRSKPKVDISAVTGLRSVESLLACLYHMFLARLLQNTWLQILSAYQVFQRQQLLALCLLSGANGILNLTNSTFAKSAAVASPPSPSPTIIALPASIFTSCTIWLVMRPII